MSKTPNYITPTGIKNLKSELKTLIQLERPAVVKTVAWAASNGDRSENADYTYGKKKLREIDKRVAMLTKKIEAAQIVDPKTVKSSQVVFGATVVVLDEEAKRNQFVIVGEDEIDISNNRISWRSPIAMALLGKKVGDEVIIRRPAGDWCVEVVQIDYI